MIDSHAHIAMCKAGASEIVDSAAAAGVTRILTIGLDEGSNREAIDHADSFDGVYASVGRHPNAAEGFDDEAGEDLRRLAEHPKVRAIGETGLDFYRDGAPREDQRRAFALQAALASELGLPLVVHVRDPDGETEAVDEVFDTLDGHQGPVILHCFSAPWRVEDAIERGWYCSFAGNVTYPSAEDLRAAAGSLPDELLLVETDSPYLSPKPVRGKPNTPANVVMTAEVVASVRGSTAESFEESVEANAARLFGW